MRCLRALWEGTNALHALLLNESCLQHASMYCSVLAHVSTCSPVTAESTAVCTGAYR